MYLIQFAEYEAYKRFSLSRHAYVFLTQLPCIPSQQFISGTSVI